METDTLEVDSLVSTAAYCGPATVLAIGPTAVTVQLPSREARAEMALAYPYQPQVNDIVLALGLGDGAVYVVGILNGRGRTRLQVDGDLCVEAGGSLTLRGRAGVAVEGERVSVTADRYELLVRSVVERLGSVHRWVKDVISTSAGRTRTVVEHGATLAAGRIVAKAKADVVIDGERIRLG